MHIVCCRHSGCVMWEILTFSEFPDFRGGSNFNSFRREKTVLIGNKKLSLYLL
jgi:hypothetical protein